MSTLLLFESASGYALFDVVEAEEVGSLLQEQEAVNDMQRFSRTVKLKAFQPFTSAESALENMNAVSEAVVTEDLLNFLEMNTPKVKKASKAKFVLGVIEPAMGSAIQDRMNIPCRSDDLIREIIRGIRCHFSR
jgi:nucleolar protein 56